MPLRVIQAEGHLDLKTEPAFQVQEKVRHYPGRIFLTQEKIPPVDLPGIPFEHTGKGPFFQAYKPV